jgi:transposase-like protein
MSQSKNGVAAKELERQLGVTYKCAWRIAKQIRLLMKSGGDPLTGIIEADETYIGGKRKGKRGRGAAGKTAVFGMVERDGTIKTQVVDNVQGKTLTPIIQENVAPGSTVSTDELASYNRLGALGYVHGTVTHGKGEYVKGIFHTNNLEGYWSQLKRSINGTYHAVSRKHLPSYLDEFSFRYDHRCDMTALPVTMFSRVGKRG